MTTSAWSTMKPSGGWRSDGSWISHRRTSGLSSRAVASVLVMCGVFDEVIKFRNLTDQPKFEPCSFPRILCPKLCVFLASQGLEVCQGLLLPRASPKSAFHPSSTDFWPGSLSGSRHGSECLSEVGWLQRFDGIWDFLGRRGGEGRVVGSTDRVSVKRERDVSHLSLSFPPGNTPF